MPQIQVMRSSFQVYIDESGDDGFVFNADGTGSSRWFVLSAVVIRTRSDLELVKCVAEVRQLLNRPTNYPLHFVKLKHEHRKPYVALIGRAPVRCFSVVAHKPSCLSPQSFRAEKNLFYHYLIRLLLERVSWYCRDHRVAGDGDGRADVTFSNRGSMSYQAVREYLSKLKANPADVRIDWNVIDPNQVVAVAHEKLAGLQAADATASSTYYAVNLNRFGQTEAAYATSLLPTFYRHGGQLRDYGIKWWPDDFAAVKTANPHLEELAAWK